MRPLQDPYKTPIGSYGAPIEPLWDPHTTPVGPLQTPYRLLWIPYRNPIEPLWDPYGDRVTLQTSYGTPIEALRTPTEPL